MKNKNENKCWNILKTENIPHEMWDTWWLHHPVVCFQFLDLFWRPLSELNNVTIRFAVKWFVFNVFLVMKVGEKFVFFGKKLTSKLTSESDSAWRVSQENWYQKKIWLTEQFFIFFIFIFRIFGVKKGPKTYGKTRLF